MGMSSVDGVIVVNHLSFSWPDGTPVLDDVTGVFGAGRTGLVGLNGAGKTTLLRLIAGELTPTSGAVTVQGSVAYLPQTIALSRDRTVADLLGVGDAIRALRAIERGKTDPALFDAVGSDWDVEDRAARMLAGLADVGGGLADVTIDREATSLSGGEAMLVAIAGCRLRRCPVTLLDEPTNNLDAVMRGRVLDMIRSWQGAVVVVSHDVGLLELMDATAELRDHRLGMVRGGYSQWRHVVEVEQEAALRAQASAEARLREAKRLRSAVMKTHDTSLAQGRRRAVGKGIGKLAQDARRDRAEASSSRDRGMAEERLAEARRVLGKAQSRIRDDDRIEVDLPDTVVPSGRRILEINWGRDSHVIIEGPRRVRLSGRSGAGKTTLIERLLRTMPGSVPSGSVPSGSASTDVPSLGSRGSSHEQAGDAAPEVAGTAASADASSSVRGRLFTDRVGYLPQRIGLDGAGLDESLDAVHNVMPVAPDVPEGEIRQRLARLLIRGDMALRPVAGLSGGERFRVALARLLFADPPAQLLILDEPTNNLDRPSVDRFVEAMNGYHGALLLVSHDEDVVSRLGIELDLRLADGKVTPMDSSMYTVRKH